MKQISFIIPSFNEADNVSLVVAAIQQQMQVLPYTYELVFIDDGSSDQTLARLRELHAKDAHVEYVSFSRNFGKEAALIAGLQYASGDAVILMDGDLQHPPSLIPELLAGYEEGYDQVIAKRNRTGDSFLRSKLSSFYYQLVNRMVEVDLADGEGDFRCLSRKAVDELVALGETNRFSKGLYAWIGLNQLVIPYENEQRAHGETKWSLKQLINYGVDGILSFNSKPLRIFFYLGAITFSVSLLYIILTFFQIIRHGIDVPGYFTVISAVLFIGSIQLIGMGVIGEYIGRIYNETKKRPHYIVKERSKKKGAHHEETISK